VIPSNRVPTHPGEILKEEFLAPLGLSQVTLAAHVGVPIQRINELIRGKRGITSDTAWLLSQAFGTSPEFWVNLQANYDLARSRPRRRVRQLPKSMLTHLTRALHPTQAKKRAGERGRCAAR
jgi:addiction module HigA family antidote